MPIIVFFAFIFHTLSWNSTVLNRCKHHVYKQLEVVVVDVMYHKQRCSEKEHAGYAWDRDGSATEQAEFVLQREGVFSKQHYLERADDSWKRNDVSGARSALDSGVIIYPNDIDIVAYSALATVYYNDANEKKQELYEKALELSERAVKIDPNRSIGYVCRIISVANLFAFANVFQSIDYIARVRSDFEMATKLGNAPVELMSAAHTVFAIIVFESSKTSAIFRFPFGLTWTTQEYGLSLFEKGIAMINGSIFGYAEYAKALAYMGEKKKARLFAEKAIASPYRFPNDDLVKKRAKDLLRSIEGEK